MNKVLRYFNKKNNKVNTEIAIYDPLKNDNYFQSFHSLILENSFRGTIVCLGDIHIKKSASFSGDLVCRTCKIEGSFNGTLLSTEFTGVCKSAILDAKIVTASIFIESNAVVKGIFNITKNIPAPESIRKLEATFKQSLPQENDENTDTKKITTILLRGKPVKALPADLLPKSETPPLDVKKGNTPVNTLTHPPENKMNRSKDNTTPNPNTGWW